MTALATTLVWSCESTDPAEYGCLNDKQCKGNRICNQGMCTAPTPRDESGEPPAARGSSTRDAAIDMPEPTVEVPDGGTTDPVPSSSAAVKFCNNLEPPGGGIILLTLIFDTAPGRPRLTAESGGGCSPGPSLPCQPIPSGASVPFSLWMDDAEIGNGVLANVEPGDQYVLSASADSMGSGSVFATKLRPTLSCSAVGHVTEPDATGPLDVSASCDADPDAGVCSMCIAERCCAQVQECFINIECLQLVQCVLACPEDDVACDDDCTAQHPSAIRPLNDYLDCGAVTCAADC